MQRHKLSNILLEERPQFFRAPSLYYSSDKPASFDEAEGAWRLEGPGAFDFTTYFNALPVIKWLRYTNASSFSLHLEVKGATCEFIQTRADTYSWSPDLLQDSSRRIDESSEWKSIDIPLTVGDDVLVGFVLDTDGEAWIKNSYYYTDIDESYVRAVELALCTTTFKNERYILPNVELVKEKVIGSNEAIAEHFEMHVVDNGRTLDAKDVESEHIHLHPNPNAGGAGGFARGMIEAIEQETKATHVLLMDDDVSISPESLIRTFNLISIVNDEYSEAFLSGAMLIAEQPSKRHEDIGFVAPDGFCYAVKLPAHVDDLHACVTGEALLRETHKEAEFMSQSYAAWWFCVIPMTVIEREGLPLPIFIRYDDVEYNLRSHAKLMTMNGICVWHASFEQRYRSALERYQAPRNMLIGKFASGIAPAVDIDSLIKRPFELELKKFNYTDAALVLEAFEDFLKGPGFIMQKGMAEKRYLESMKNAEQLEPLDDIKPEALELGVDLDSMPTMAFDDSDLRWSDHRSPVEHVVDFWSVNGNRAIPGGYTKPGSVGVLNAAGWFYPVDDLRQKEYIIAIDPYAKKGVIRKLDRVKFKELMERYKRDMVEFRLNKEKLKEEYEGALEEMTSIAFWKDYLGV